MPILFYVLVIPKNGISETEIDQILVKLEMLKQLEIELEDEIFKEKYQQINTGQLKTNYISEDGSQVITRLVKPIQKDYENYFKEKLPNCKNQILEDFEYYHMAANATQVAYQLKFSSACSLISSLYQQKGCNNWGIKKEVKNDQNRYITFYADYEGFNMPLTVHLPKKELFDYIKEHEKQPCIPIYKGNEDMKVFGLYMKAPLFMLLDKEKTKKTQEIAQTIKIGDERKHFIDHLAYIANHKKVPEHLKEKTNEYKKGKDGKKYQVSKLVQEWYDFENRNFYRKTAKGEMELIKHSGKELTGH